MLVKGVLSLGKVTGGEIIALRERFAGWIKQGWVPPFLPSGSDDLRDPPCVSPSIDSSRL